MHKLVSILFVLLAMSSVFAQETSTQVPADMITLSLEDALNRAPDYDANVLTARSSLSAAERDLTRTRQDPLSLRLEIVQAQQAFDAAQKNLEVAILAAQSDVASAYYDALSAEKALEIAKMQQQIDQNTLEATQVRLNAGAATQLDLERAQNSLTASERSVRDAQQQRDLAFQNLESLLSLQIDALNPDVPEPSSEPAALEDVLARAQAENAQLLQAQRAVELAQVQLESIDNAFSAQADIDTAEDNLNNAIASLADVKRALDITVQQSYISLLAALGSYESALENYATSIDDLIAQQTRLDAGSISPLDFQQTEVSHANTEAALNSALYNAQLAYLQLEKAIIGQ